MRSAWRSGSNFWQTYGAGQYDFNFTSNAAVNDGNWHQITAVRLANGTGQIFIDGTLNASAAGTIEPLGSNINVYLGADVRDAHLRPQRLCSSPRPDRRCRPAILNRALSPAEVQAIAANGSPATDQRGLPRVANGTVDIGSVETQPYLVTNTNDAGPGSLRQAVIDDAAGDQPVVFASGLAKKTITLTSGPILISHNLTINGLGADQLTVSGGGAVQDFVVTSGSVTISGLTIANGAAIQGGGLFNSGNLTLINDVFTGDSARNDPAVSGGKLALGGAIYNAPGASLTVTGSDLLGRHGHRHLGLRQRRPGRRDLQLCRRHPLGDGRHVRREFGRQPEGIWDRRLRRLRRHRCASVLCRRQRPRRDVLPVVPQRERPPSTREIGLQRPDCRDVLLADGGEPRREPDRRQGAPRQPLRARFRRKEHPHRADRRARRDDQTLHNSQTASSFSGGEYLSWVVSGHVMFKITALASNAVISGVFFDAAPAGTTGPATFLGTDSTTQGNWRGASPAVSFGGAIDNAGTASVSNSTFSGNSEGTGGDGSGIENEAGASLNLLDSIVARGTGGRDLVNLGMATGGSDLVTTGAGAPGGPRRLDGRPAARAVAEQRRPNPNDGPRRRQPGPRLGRPDQRSGI